MKKPSLEAASPVKEGSLADSRSAQDIPFPVKTARYICLQALSSQNGDEFTTLAELDALDAAGHAISHKGWKILYVDSEENLAEGDQAEKAMDGDPDPSGTRFGARRIRVIRTRWLLISARNMSWPACACCRARIRRTAASRTTGCM